MKRKPPALRNIGIDLDGQALERFECDYPVELIHGCAHRFLAEYEYRGRELVYCDPPYLEYTRSSGRRYRFDYAERDHVALLTLLERLPCQVTSPAILRPCTMSTWPGGRASSCR